MTNDYKTTLLEYLTGNLQEEAGVNIPQFSNVATEDSSLYNDLMATFTNGFVEKGTIKCKDSSGEYNGKTIIYGYYYINSSQTYSTSKGFIALLDEKLSLIELITQFSSGTDFSKFQYLTIDEEGRLFGIDIPSGSSSARFLMLNNVSIKANSAQHYVAVLRTSYNLQGNAGTYPIMITKVIKQYNGANYYMQMSNGLGTNLKINVGIANEWTDFSYQNVADYQYTDFMNVEAYWDNEENISIVLLEHTLMLNGIHIIAKGTNDENNVIQMVQLYDITNDLFGGADGISVYMDYPGSQRTRYMRSISAYILNPTHLFFVVPVAKFDLDTEENDIIIKVIENNNGTTTTKYEYTYEEQVGDHSSVLSEISMINNQIFANFYVCENTTSSNPFYTVYTGIILNQDTTRIIDLAMVRYGYETSFNIIDITNIFNLYILNAITYSYEQDKFKYSKSILIFNANNYNGEAYCNTNTLIPNQIWLYDENDNIMFARNLYNKTIYNNITEATIEVPNTMLNDLTISTQKLIGETNYILCENTDDIEKNIYETLYINFFITLLMQNRNTLDYITNLPGSNRINDSVSETKDYDNAKIGKVRINYTNGTSKTKDIISSTITNNIADIQFQLTILSDILNIEILSNDGLTTYQTITDFTDYDIGKTYTISQKCYVE